MPVSDFELREMRDSVYPAFTAKQIQCDASWEQVKKYWREDEEWLRGEYAKVMAKRSAMLLAKRRKM